MKKLLILGSAGMLGHVVCKYFEGLGNYKVVNASFPERFKNDSIVLDVTDSEGLRQFLNAQQPDIVINCVGMLIKGSNKDPASAVYLNAFLPHYLSRELSRWGAKLVHVSTDCVFSGVSGSYSESAPRDAEDMYGRSKALGEVANEKDLTLRTSIIGPELKQVGEGLFHWFMHQPGTVNGYTRVFWSGLTTLELAKIIEAAIEQGLTGLINVPAKERISKFDLLNKIRETFKFPCVRIIPYDLKQEDKSLISERRDFLYDRKDYDQMLYELFVFMTDNKELYSGYFAKS